MQNNQSSYQAKDNDPLMDQIYKKAVWKILPLLLLGYFINFLDRTNIGIAALQMGPALHFTPTIFATGASIFFLPYALCEIPSNLLMTRVGPRIWFTRIMVTWGLIAAGMSLVVGPNSFYALRFLLGVAEAGYVPCFLFYLALWFPSAYLARANALIIMGSPLSSVIGSPLSGGLLSMDGVWGLTGWQWLFIVEGMPAVIVGILIYFWLYDDPSKAHWLTEREKSHLVECLRNEESNRKKKHDYSLTETFLHPRLLLICLVNFFWCVGFYGYLFWLPQIIKGFGDLSNFKVSVLNALPALFGAVGMVLWAVHSDKNGERNWHVALPMFLAALALAVSTRFGTPAYSMVALVFAGVGFYAFYSAFYTLAPAFLSGTAAAGGLALMTTAGNVGGFIGPYVVAWFRESFGDFKYALIACAICLVFGGLIMVLMRHGASAREEEDAPGPFKASI